MMPKSHRLPFLFEASKTTTGRKEIAAWVEHLLTNSRNNPSNKAVRNELKQVCMLVVSHNKVIRDNPREARDQYDLHDRFEKFSGKVIGVVSTASLYLLDVDLFVDTLGMAKSNMPLSAYRMAGRALYHVEMSKLEKELVCHAPLISDVLLTVFCQT